MAETKVGMPTMGGVTSSMMDFAVGLGGGIIFALSSALIGSGMIGGLIGAGIAGSVIKGSRGTVIATILGFQSIVSSLGQGSPASASANEDTM